MLSDQENSKLWFNNLTSGEEQMLLYKYNHKNAFLSTKEVEEMWKSELSESLTNRVNDI